MVRHARVEVILIVPAVLLKQVVLVLEVQVLLMQRLVVSVSLPQLKSFGLELRDQQVLLVVLKSDGVVRHFRNGR